MKTLEEVGQIFKDFHDKGFTRVVALHDSFPKVICLCGSTRFKNEFNEVNLQLTLAGYIVLTVGSFMHSDTELKISDEKKVELDVLHKRKIDIADAVLVLNVNEYIGSSTRSEIDYTSTTGKAIDYLWDGTGAKNPVDVVDRLFINQGR